jgi:hypothetical protein
VASPDDIERNSDAENGDCEREQKSESNLSVESDDENEQSYCGGKDDQDFDGEGELFDLAGRPQQPRFHRVSLNGMAEMQAMVTR